MMIEIIREQSEIEQASDEVLHETYLEMTGKPLMADISRGALEVKVKFALMSAKDRHARSGLQRGEVAKALTLSELANREKSKAAWQGLKKAPEMTEESLPQSEAASAENPFKKGTMGHQLWTATNAVPPNDAKKKSERPERKKDRTPILKVQATFNGHSKMQSGSQRSQVLDYVQKRFHNVATVQEIELHFGMPVRGYLQKLIEAGHLRAVPLEDGDKK